MDTKHIEKIEKEAVAGLHFPDHEVLSDNALMVERDLDLKRALALGNLEHSKIKIIFEDDKSIKQVETTVWGVTDKRIILKQGVVIPIKRVHQIKL